MAAPVGRRAITVPSLVQALIEHAESCESCEVGVNGLPTEPCSTLWVNEFQAALGRRVRGDRPSGLRWNGRPVVEVPLWD